MRSPLNLLTVEEYLKFEQDGEIRHEYVAGQIYAMAGEIPLYKYLYLN
jgi:Uma2 family endonuclease